jgi:LPXTG-motif cell wall-anchored protein
MIRRPLHLAAALLLALVSMAALIATPAQAAQQQTGGQPPPYSGVCNLSLSASQASSTSATQLTVSGTSFPASTNIPIVLDSSTQLGTANVDAAGAFSTQVTLPAGLTPGLHTISVACATSDIASTVDIGVLGIDITTAPATTAPGATTGPVATGPLARTGSDSKPEVVIALGAIGIGAALVLATRRRRARNTV